MNLSSTCTAAIVALSVLAVASGCGKKKAPSTAGYDSGDDMVTPGLISDADGMPLTGTPFDQDPNRSEVTGLDIAPIYFGYDSFVLPPAEISKIQRVADVLSSNSGYVLIVEGHCDERGSNEYNLSLGEQRAGAVRSYIVNLGIDADRIQTRSYGEERPAVGGTGESAWRMNRRGEFVFYR